MDVKLLKDFKIKKQLYGKPGYLYVCDTTV